MNIAFRWVLTACLIGSSTLLGSSALAQNNSSQNNSSQTETAQDAQYTVQKGDTAFSISRRYNLSLEQLMTLNALTDSSVQLGQVLTVVDVNKDVTENSSGHLSKTAPVRVSSEPTATTLALEMPRIQVQAPRLPITALSASSEMMVFIAPQIVPPVPRAAPSTAPTRAPTLKTLDTSSHTVQKGDTAYSIAKRYGLRLERLLSLNMLSSAQVSLGQVLRVREDKAPAPLEPTSSGPTSSGPTSSAPN